MTSTDSVDPSAATASSGTAPYVLASADQMRAFGAELAKLLRAGDLLVLTGALGAGKTTLTQGIAAGLQVRGPVVSPTFTIAREYPSLVAGPALVHVDAYRLGSLDDLDALDLDTSLGTAVTVIEWGEGLAEVLSDDRLEVTIERPRGGTGVSGQARSESTTEVEAEADADVEVPRRVTIRAVGSRWAEVPPTIRVES